MSEAKFYGWLLGAWVVVALATVPYLLLRPAPYGRHGRPGWGKVVNARLAWVRPLRTATSAPPIVQPCGRAAQVATDSLKATPARVFPETRPSPRQPLRWCARWHSRRRRQSARVF